MNNVANSKSEGKDDPTEDLVGFVDILGVGDVVKECSNV